MGVTVTRTSLLALLALLAGCDLLEQFQEDPPNCEDRSTYWPDTDADGVGDPGTVYVGCKAPEGYTDVPPDTDAGETDCDSDDTDLCGTDTDCDSDDTDLCGANAPA